MNARWLLVAATMIFWTGCTSPTPPASSPPPSQAERLTDDFGLPLVIVIDNVPEVPKELIEPSRPVVEQPRAPARQ
jgi:hypothetical protein